MDWDRSCRLLEIAIAWNGQIIFLLFCGRTIKQERWARQVLGTCIVNFRDMSRTSRKLITETGRVNLQYRLPRPVAMLLWACSFSCGWPGEAKTWPKIALRVGGRAEYSVLEDGRPNSVPPPVPQHSTFPPVLQHVALFLATFWPLLASWSRVRRNDLYHRFRLGQMELLRPTCKIATGSL